MHDSFHPQTFFYLFIFGFDLISIPWIVGLESFYLGRTVFSLFLFFSFGFFGFFLWLLDFLDFFGLLFYFLFFDFFKVCYLKILTGEGGPLVRSQ